MLGEHYAYITRTKVLLHCMYVVPCKHAGDENYIQFSHSPFQHSRCKICSCLIWKTFIEKQHRVFFLFFKWHYIFLPKLRIIGEPFGAFNYACIIYWRQTVTGHSFFPCITIVEEKDTWTITCQTSCYMAAVGV